jgi:hypothetical protein
MFVEVKLDRRHGNGNRNDGEAYRKMFEVTGLDDKDGKSRSQRPS